MCNGFSGRANTCRRNLAGAGRETDGSRFSHRYVTHAELHRNNSEQAWKNEMWWEITVASWGAGWQKSSSPHCLVSRAKGNWFSEGDMDVRYNLRWMFSWFWRCSRSAALALAIICLSLRARALSSAAAFCAFFSWASAANKKKN